MSLSPDEQRLVDERERAREIETLAREFLALQRWAENIAHASRRRNQALRIYWDYFCEGGVKTPKRWRGENATEDWWHRYERYQARVDALLAEYAEMKEKP